MSRWRFAKYPGVRLLLLAGGMLALLIALQVVIQVLARAAPIEAKSAFLVGLKLLSCAVLILAYQGGVRLLEERTASEVALSSDTWQILPGACLGIAIFSIVYLILWAGGIARYEGLGQSAGIGVAAASALAAGVGEEIVFRGVIFRIMAERLGTTAGISISATIFGLLHAFNPGATVLSTAAVGIEAGVLLASAYALAGTLWLPIGLHFGWNFSEGAIFGAAVSGGHSSGLLVFPLRGPDLLTGGAFGPEASIWSIAVCLAVSAILIATTIYLRRWRPFALKPQQPSAS